MQILTALMFFVSGILFQKAFSSILDFGILSNAIEKVTKELLFSLVFIEQDIQFLIESRKIILREKGMSDNEIEHLTLIHDRSLRMWREKVIVTLINNFPPTFKEKCLPFSNWQTAAQYVNDLIKEKRTLANSK
jgi:hypothetical protein